jgi:cytochrome c oxidase subunit 2
MTRRAVAATLVGLAVAGTSACSSSMGLPASATRQGDEVTSLWRIFLVLATLVAGLIWVLTFYVILSSVRRRRAAGGSDTIPRQRQYNPWLEATYTAIPLILVVGLLGLTFKATGVLTDTSQPSELDVKVTGFQWQWQFEYPDKHIVMSGTPEADAELWLPVGRNVRFTLVANDVIHSFWVPEFLEKRDLIPGVENQIEVFVNAPGRWTGRCAEFCGFDHWQMTFDVCAVTPDQFDAWVADTAGHRQPVLAGAASPGPSTMACPSPPAATATSTGGGT